ncbi:MAG: alpha/beta fold hydrolase [Xanthobacteraceae bacterium]|nr:alpha/beta fold hydrolase [Xanthobacteraceae bacterium]
MQSKRATLAGHQVHYLEGGSGFPILMLHGVGPGTSVVGNFGPVLEPLSQRFHIFAMDLIGFGGSERSRNKPYFDVELWVWQADDMLALMPVGPVGIIGHSMGGAMALKLAARNPRIVKAMTSCTVGVPYPINAALNGFWSAPGDRTALRQAMSRMVCAAESVTDAMIEDRWKLLRQEGYPDYCAELFAEPRQRLLDAAVLTDDEIGRIGAQVVMLHGRDDQPCPPEQTTLVLSRKLPRADVHLLGACGHNLPRERSAAFIEIASGFFGKA